MSDSTTRARNLLRDHWALLLPAVAYLGIFPWLPELRSPNELCRLHQARALVDHHSIEINEVLRTQGWVGDLSCVAVARDPSGAVRERRACPNVRGSPEFREEHYFPSKAPLLSFAAAPVYGVLRHLRGERGVPEQTLVYFARLFVTILPALLLLIPLRRFLRAHLATAVADAVTVFYALGTLAFSYAQLFMSHQTAAVVLFLCFYAMWRARTGAWHRWGYALAGLFGGLTVATEYTAALGLIPLAAYALWTAPGGTRGRVRAALLGIGGMIPPVAALMLYHHAAYGGPLTTGYKYLNDLGYQGWHQGGFLGIRLPQAHAFWMSLFSPLRGLFALSPALLLALPGFAPRFWTRERRPELMVGLATLALYLYFTSSFSYESWGWTTGPRHLTGLVPFLLLPLGLFVEASRERPAVAGICAGLVALSILATSAMTFLDYIPDSLTNALWQVALPFAVRGYLPHSPLSLLGVPNPWAALPAVLAVLAAAALAARALLPETRRAIASLAGLATVLLVAGGHASIGPQDAARAERDRGTYEFLEQRYVPRPGRPSP